jgi:1-aminocyclopropane-1-carboxylate deaminase
MESVQWRYEKWIVETQQSSVNYTLRQAWHLPEWESGNKRFKLFYNAQDALQKGFDTIITMGGAWSNHLLATAQYARNNGMSSVGLVRGFWHKEQPTLVMRDCEQEGMEVVPIDTALYDERGTEDFKVWLHDHYPHAYFIPEGGANYLGIMGCMELLTPKDKEQYSDFCICAGTGTSAAGLLLSTTHQKVHAFFGLKLSASEMREMVRQKLRWVLHDAEAVEEVLERLEVYGDDRWGGFGKIQTELIDWMEEEDRKGFKWDRVYSAKMAYAIANGPLTNPLGVDVLLVHTGGLSGNRSLETIGV